jgi:hypothetical protein
MKKKTKKKKPVSKTVIKRPAHKKPRPKKHVEAKIPQLPPVPTQVVEAQEAPIEQPVPVEPKVTWGKPIEGTTQVEPGIYVVNKPYAPGAMCTPEPKKSGLFSYLRKLLGF